MIKPTYFDAVQNLTDNKALYGNTDGAISEGEFKWLEDTDDGKPTEEAIQTKLSSMISDWEALAWKRSREAEYPSIAELTVALYDTDDKAAIEAKRAAVLAYS